MDDLVAASEVLAAADPFVPGYIAPQVGVYHPAGHAYARYLEKYETVLVPDRNVLSRIVQLAQGESCIGVDVGQRRAAATILAYAQLLDFLVDPALALHESASANGNEQTWDELAWFRLADNIPPKEWLDIALGRAVRIESVGVPQRSSESNFALPLRRWRRNYIAALKVAELELDSKLTAFQKVLRLLHWMFHDFMVAGPAAILACIYLAPKSPPRKRMFKGLRSPIRDRALAGVKNAAWDITYVSEFVARVNASETNLHRRYIFASFDRGLVLLARSVLSAVDGPDTPKQVSEILRQWWPSNEAEQISRVLLDYFSQAADPERYKRQREAPASFIDDITFEGEKNVLSWRS